MDEREVSKLEREGASEPARAQQASKAKQTWREAKPAYCNWRGWGIADVGVSPAAFSSCRTLSCNGIIYSKIRDLV